MDRVSYIGMLGAVPFGVQRFYVKRLIRFWTTMTLTLLSACGGTGASPSQPIDSTPPPPVAITPVGVWNVVESAIESSCTQATVTLVKSESIINHNIPDPGIAVSVGAGLSGSMAGCTTLSPLAIAPMTTVQGLFYVNEVMLFLFHQGDPTIWSSAQMIWIGTQSDANHMSGNVYSTPAGSGYALGNSIGTWSASK